MPDASEASTSKLPLPSTSSITSSSTSTSKDESARYDLPAEAKWWHDAVAGFTGGAAGILAANPLDLLKVREQVASTHGLVPSPPSKASTASLAAKQSSNEGIARGLRTLYRTEGWRVFFAGSFGPVVSYAIIDGFYFSIWGRTMELRHQDREDPNSMFSSFLAGAAAGTACAILQTPIEVVKVRAQIEREAAGRARLGSVGIMQKMMQKEGPRGFFAGFWPTLLRDGLANGIFFPCYHISRRVLRGEHPIYTREEALRRQGEGKTSIFRVAAAEEGQKLTANELGRIAIAGGFAGALSMILTYPFDVIKTQAQQLIKASGPQSRPTTSFTGIARQVYREGQLDAQRRDPQFAQRTAVSRYLRSARGFGRGFKLGVATSALQSALILPVFEGMGAVLGGSRLHSLYLTIHPQPSNLRMQAVTDFAAAARSKLGKAAAVYKSDDDAVVAKKGGLKDMCPEDLLSTVLQAVISRSGIDPALIEDVAVGNVLPPGGGATVARMAALHAGIPNSAAVNTLNRQCSSGLASVAQIAHEIQLGQIEVGIGAGVESMTQNYGAGVMPEKMSDEVMSNGEAADCLLPMGITSENVAEQYGISRQVQDEFAANSFAKALEAQRSGKFKDEIVPVKAHWSDPKDESEKELTVTEDDGIRANVTAESLSKLKPAFSKTGSTHAGNASQVSDGAAAVLLVKRSTAKRLGLPILGKYVRSAVVGVPPNVMGIGPAFAIPKVLELSGISKDEIDIYEINEAFASQAVMSVQHLNLDIKKVNPNGGAIPLGHPLGATGSRQIATLFPEMKRQNATLGVTSMCVGSGMGMAALFVNEQ